MVYFETSIVLFETSFALFETSGGNALRIEKQLIDMIDVFFGGLRTENDFT